MSFCDHGNVCYPPSSRPSCRAGVCPIADQRLTTPLRTVQVAIDSSHHGFGSAATDICVGAAVRSAPTPATPQCMNGLVPALVAGGFSGSIDCQRDKLSVRSLGKVRAFGRTFSIYSNRYKLKPVCAECAVHGGQRIIFMEHGVAPRSYARPKRAPSGKPRAVSARWMSVRPNLTAAVLPVCPVSSSAYAASASWLGSRRVYPRPQTVST
jgi:hypothetical protein